MFKVQKVPRWILPAIAAFMAAVFFGSCMNNGTEIPNGNSRMVSGRLVDENNQPVAGASVRMLAVNYVPSLTSAKTASLAPATTDANGNYQITVSDTGVYNIDCRKDTLGAFIDSVEVSSSLNTVQVADHFMKKLGTIKGVSYMPGQSDTNQVRVTLYIPGTGRITKPVIGGAFTFDNVPEGSYQIIIDPTLNDYNVKVVGAVLLSGHTLDLGTVELPVHQANTLTIDAFSADLITFKLNALSISGDTINGTAPAFRRLVLFKDQYDLTAQLPTFVIDSITGQSSSKLAFYPVTPEPKTYSCTLDNLGKQFVQSNVYDTSAVYEGNFGSSGIGAYFHLKSVTETVTSTTCNYYAGKGFTFGWGYYYPPYGKITIQYQ